MPLLLLKDLPRFDCLLQAAERYPALEPSAFEGFLHLLRTGDSVFASESAFLAEHGISQGRFTVLMLLNRHCNAPSTPAGLADQAAVTRATMSGLMDTLEKDGMLIRETAQDDRRTVLVRLTEKGQQIIDSLLPDYCRRVSAIMEPLTAPERKQLVHLLQKIQQGLAPEPAAQEPVPLLEGATA
jgi:DNA-binding MarR family transcriptional regulator